MKVSQLVRRLQEEGFAVSLEGGGGFDSPLLRACFDSRRVIPGDLFCALPGRQFQGQDFVEQAYERGASAVLTQAPVALASLPSLRVKNQALPTFLQVAGNAAHILSGFPSAKIWVGAVTGTNGKSTVVHLVHQALQHGGEKAGIAGTLGMQMGDWSLAIPNTTTSADYLHQWLQQVVAQQAPAAVLEASSIGVEQQRLSGIKLDCAAWTNLSRDHLDMHGTMEAYARAKAQLFWNLPAQATALIPLQQPIQELCASLAARTLTWALDNPKASLHGHYVSSAEGLQLQVNGVFGRASMQSSLLGRHNAENLLLAFGMLAVYGWEAHQAAAALSRCTPVPGRLQKVAPEFPAHLFVDYAHTPEALAHVLDALRQAFPSARLGVVFGAGGDRDAGKRAPMGQAVGQHADWCVVTSDNPRSESPEKIVDEVLLGVQQTSCTSWAEVDRRQAIALALQQLKPQDVLLVAGKGHETYQEIHGVRHPFDDVLELKEAVRCLA